MVTMGAAGGMMEGEERREFREERREERQEGW